MGFNLIWLTERVEMLNAALDEMLEKGVRWTASILIDPATSVPQCAHATSSSRPSAQLPGLVPTLTGARPLA